MILDDDGYRAVEVRDVQPGDVVTYRDSTGNVSHVGVVISHDKDLPKAQWKTTVLSQWGADGEYIHDVGDVHELLGKPYKFYSERSGR